MFDGQEGGVSSIVHTIKSFQGATNVEVAGGLVVVPRWGATRSGIQIAIAYHI